MSILIKIVNNATNLEGNGEIALLASRTGYWELSGGNHVETDEDGVIVGFALELQSADTNDLTQIARFAVSAVNNVKVGKLTTNGAFAAYLSS